MCFRHRDFAIFFVLVGGRGQWEMDDFFVWLKSTENGQWRCLVANARAIHSSGSFSEFIRSTNLSQYALNLGVGVRQMSALVSKLKRLDDVVCFDR